MPADPKLAADDFAAIAARLREIERGKTPEPPAYLVAWKSSWDDGAWRRRPEMPAGSAEIGDGLWLLPDGAVVRPVEVETGHGC